MRHRKATTALGVASTLVVVLGGCAGLPTTSRVSTGQAIDSAANREPLSIEPDGPSPDESPQEIVSDFLLAQMSTKDNYGIARSFLTPSAASRWHPGQSVTVFSGASDITVSRPSATTASLSVPVVATLSADGRLERAAKPTRRTLEFTLTRASNGWRVAQPPPDSSVWMSQTDLLRLYTQVNVYYPSKDRRTLVADPRWLTRQGLPTALARAALSAPPSWLRPAIASVWPSGGRLDLDAAPVDDAGRARITLNRAASAASDADRAAIWASLTATLRQSPDVSSVEVVADGSRLDVPGLQSPASSPSEVGYLDPTSEQTAVIVRSGPYLAWADPTATSATGGTTKEAARGRPRLPAVGGEWTDLAAGSGGHLVAGVDTKRTRLRVWRDGSPLTTVSLGTRLARPSFDRSSRAWTAGRSQGQSVIWAIGQRTDAFTPSWLTDTEVQTVSAAPDGDRLALVLKRTQGTKTVRTLAVTAVIRDATGRPVGLGPLHQLSGQVDDPKDVAWADPATLVVLGRSGGTVQPVLATLDGDVRPLGTVTGQTGVASLGAGETGVFVRAGRSVYSRLGSSWNSYLSGGDVIVPGL